MKNLPIYLAAVALVLTFVSCDNKEETPVRTYGQITGQLKLVDEFGVQLTDHFGVKISEDGGKYDISDASGNYQVNNLSEATYSLTYEKTGYAVYKKFGLEVVPANGNGTTIISDTIKLAPVSTTVPSALTMVLDPVDSTFTFSCSLSPLPGTNYPRAFRLFFSKSSDVTASDYLFAPSSYWTGTTSSVTVTGFERAEFYNNGFVSGDTVYAIAYGETIVSNSYLDPVAGQIFPNINTASPSNVAMIVLP